jgi:hypothetical protein
VSSGELSPPELSEPSPLEALVQRFAAAQLTRREWKHTTHLQVGAWYVHHLGKQGALDVLRDSIRRLNERHGTPNSDERGYHETITRAYVELIADFFTTFGPAVELEARVRALLASPLADREALLRYWSREVLFSVEARRGWVAPNLAPLP